MAENKDKLNNQPVSEESGALESFLGREQEASKPVKTSKINKRILIIIIALLVVAVLAVLLIVLRSTPASTLDEEDYETASLELSVNDDGGHEASVTLDSSGNPAHNGSGTLLSYVPSDIKEIHVENAEGSFDVKSETPQGEATVYTLVGFEDIELQEGIADEVASDASSVEFIQIAAAGARLADFGLDEPKATVKVSFNDDTYAAIRVGSAAAAGAGTYIAFGSSSDVYLVADDAVDAFMYGVTEFVSREVTSSTSDAENSGFSTATISGTRYPEPITLVPNTDEAVDAAYLVTAPRRMYANATEAFDIAGNIRGLYAEGVVSVNPSSGQLDALGLSDPYAKIEASYSDGDYILMASAPSDDGLVNLYNPDKDIVYSIQLAAVWWANTSVEALIPEHVINVNLKAVENVEFTVAGESFSIDVSTTSVTSENDDGVEEEISTTTAVYDGKTLGTDFFSIFFQNLNGIKILSQAEDKGSELMSFTFSYSTGREPDTVVIYDTGSAQYTAQLNGDTAYSVSKSYIDSLIEGARRLINGESVTSL